MAARAMWKAKLVLGDLDVPVKLYAAAQDQAIHLHLLHEPDGARVKQRLAHAATGATVPSEQIRRGVEVERGRFLVLDDEDLAELEPAASREIELLRFVPPAAIDHRWYERPYYLGPDGDAARYAALAQAIARTGREGLARWTMRKRRYVGALRLHEDVLALVALRHAGEVVAAEELEAPAGRALDPRERALAAQLVEALAGDFDHAAFRDEYRERVLELVEQKRKGKRVKLARYRARPAGDRSLVDALRQSLQQVG